MSILENVGVTVAISFLANVELEIYCRSYAVLNLHLRFPVLSHHLGNLVDALGARLVLTSQSRCPTIFRKIHQSVSNNSKRWWNGSKYSDLGLGGVMPLVTFGLSVRYVITLVLIMLWIQNLNHVPYYAHKDHSGLVELPLLLELLQCGYSTSPSSAILASWRLI